MTNKYPGRCRCGASVQPGEGSCKVSPKASPEIRWTVCKDCYNEAWGEYAKQQEMSMSHYTAARGFVSRIEKPGLSDVSRQARALSSGTIASLTGLREYAGIDAAQAAFVAFVDRSGSAYATWQLAWNAWDGKAQHAR